MSKSDPATVTQLLAQFRHGDESALNQLLPLVYTELHEIAHQQRRRWKGDDTLDTTALVHEAYLKLVGSAGGGAESRMHFLRIAAMAMRQILCSYARERHTAKRGGESPPLSLDALEDAGQQLTYSPEQSEMILDLDAALTRLQDIDTRLGAVVECRFFAGLSVDETAEALGRSPATVKRDWALARAWLFRELKPAS